MGAGKWIVLMVLASLGGGIYVMSYLIDDETIEKYGRRVAEYNAQHNETVVDVAMHRVKRGPEFDEVSVPVGGKPEHRHSDNRVVRDGVSKDEPARRRRIIVLDVDDSDHGAPTLLDQQIENSDHEAARQTFGRHRVNEDLNPEIQNNQDADARARGQVVIQGLGKDARHKLGGQVINIENLLRDASRFSKPGVVARNPDFVNARTFDVKKDQDLLLEVEPARRRLVELDFTDPANHKIFVSTNDDEAHAGSAGTKLSTALDSYPFNDQAIDGPGKEQSGLHAESLSGGLTSEESKEVYDYRGFEAEEVHRYKLGELSEDQKFVHVLASDDEKLITFNKGIDFVLGLINTLFSLEGELSVPLPELNKTFGHGVMQGRFEADGGFFKNPATLHRTGDVAIVKNGDSVGLEVALGLATLEAGYAHYDLKILKIHQNGTLDVSVAQNSIKMKLSLTYYPHCKVDVNYLELDRLGGIKVELTGLGAFQSMVNMLSKWLTDNFTDNFRAIVNQKLIEKAKKAVAREDICKYFPLSLL